MDPVSPPPAFELPRPVPAAAYTFRQRFQLLAEPQDKIAATRFRLCPPDWFALGVWSVFDTQESRTIARGISPIEAVDHALESLGFKPEGEQ